jgi:hypothetical protein
MREAHPPQTTFSPCRSLVTEHLILHTFVASRERRGGPPLLKLGALCEPCLLSSGPPQPSLAALPSGLLETHDRFEDGAVRQDSRLDKPPQGNEQLTCQSDNAQPAQSTTSVAKALQIPLRERTLGLKAPPSPGNFNRHRADVMVAGLSDAALIGEVATGIGSGRQTTQRPYFLPSGVGAW